MSHCTWNRVSWQINSIRNSLGQQQGLPFVDLLTPDMLRQVAGPGGRIVGAHLHTLGDVVDVSWPGHRFRPFLSSGGGAFAGLVDTPRTTGMLCRNGGLLQGTRAAVGRASSQSGAGNGSRIAWQNAGAHGSGKGAA